MTTKPVLFLAFANDEARTLRNLAKEAHQLQELLETKLGSEFEVVVRQNVGLKQILDLFQDARYRNRVALFHYGGHATSYELLLEDAEGSEAVDAVWFARFLAQQRGLALVFLNACSTEEQAATLLEAGVGCVIATSQDIPDEVASEFALRFYTGLVGNASIQVASSEAVSSIAATQGEPAATWWQLHPNPAQPTAAEWKLHNTVNDWLFGLPAPPTFDLPDEPYRYLSWYGREQAELFFGRSHEIRTLFDKITETDSSPIILLYGQSGVGKSSLLAAGLLPRLEQLHTVRYVRRDAERGLVATLVEGIRGEGEGEKGEGGIEGLRARWVEQEEKSNQPLTLIIDQVEEVFTQGKSGIADEMPQFLAALKAIFAKKDGRPQGKLILGFRKEWYAEIKDLLKDQRLPHVEEFLKPLDRQSVIEVVSGPARAPRLKNHYKLTIDDLLPAVIADDLLEDRESPVAPTLQTLLSKLWRRAKEQNNSQPAFSLELYQTLKREGILLGDFLDQQLNALRQWHSSMVDSGLQLDVLTAHSSERGTAAQRTIDELLALYPGDRNGVTIAQIIQQNREKGLLVDPAGEGKSTVAATRLVHDTLAPLVRERYEKSDKPGQRARRILENRAVDWHDGETGAVLDEADLKIVEAGQAGMRAWTRDEVRLIEASRQARAARQRSRQQLRFAAIAAIAAVALFAVLAVWQWQLSQRRGDTIALQATSGAQQGATVVALATQSEAQNAQLETQATNEAELRQTANQRLDQALINESKRLTNLSLQQLSTDPVASVHLALAALPSQENARPYVAEAEFALTQAIRTAKEQFYLPIPKLQNIGLVARFSDSLALGGDGLFLIDLSTHVPLTTHIPTTIPLEGLEWSGKGLLLGYTRTSIYVWSGTKEIAAHGFLSEDGIRCAKWNPIETEIAICDGHIIRIWSPTSDMPIHTVGDVDPADTSWRRNIEWSPDGRWLAAWGARLMVWDRKSQKVAYEETRADVNAYVAQGEWLPNPDGNRDSNLDSNRNSNTVVWNWQGSNELTVMNPNTPTVTSTLSTSTALVHWKALPHQQVVTVDENYELRLWSAINAENTILIPPSLDLNFNTFSLQLYQEQFSVARQDGNVEIRDVQSGKLLTTLGGVQGHKASVTSVKWHPSGHFVATASLDGTIKIWQTENGLLQTTLAGHEHDIVTIDWVSEQRLMSVTREDLQRNLPGSVRFWDIFDQEGYRLCEQSIGQPIPFCRTYSQQIGPDAFIAPDGRWDNISRIQWNDDQTLSALGLSGTIYTVDPESKRAILLPNEVSEQREVAWAPTSDKLLIYTKEGDGQFWQRGQQSWHKLDTLDGPIRFAQWTAAGLLIDNPDGDVEFIDTSSLSLERTLVLKAAGLSQAISLGNSELAIADRIGGVYLYSVSTRQLTPLASQFSSSTPATLDASDNGSLLTAGFGTGIAQWEMNANHKLAEVAFPEIPFEQGAVRSNPEGHFVAMIQNGALVIAIPQESRLLETIDLTTYLIGVDWSRDGTHLLAWDDSSAHLLRWNGQTKQIWRTAHIQNITYASQPLLSPDGSQVIILDYARHLRAWKLWHDVPTLREDAHTCCLPRPLTEEQKREFGLE